MDIKTFSDYTRTNEEMTKTILDPYNDREILSEKNLVESVKFSHPKSKWQVILETFRTEEENELIFNVKYFDLHLMLYQSYQILYQRDQGYFDLSAWIWNLPVNKTKAYRRVIWLCKLLTPYYIRAREKEVEILMTKDNDLFNWDANAYAVQHCKYCSGEKSPCNDCTIEHSQLCLNTPEGVLRYCNIKCGCVHCKIGSKARKEVD